MEADHLQEQISPTPHERGMREKKSRGESKWKKKVVVKMEKKAVKDDAW